MIKKQKQKIFNEFKSELKKRNMSVTDLAKEIKVSYGCLYYNFKGKNEMLLCNYLKIKNYFENGKVNNKRESEDYA